MEYVDEILNNIKKEYPKYKNYINNYYIKNKKPFLDRSLDYCTIPKDCRTNIFLESYNEYIKKKLGEKRIINWVNFIYFLKEESERWINKLSDITNNYNTIDNNISYSDKYYNITNEFENETKLSNIYFQFPFQKNGKTENLKENEININENISLNNNIFPMKGIINSGYICYAIAGLQVLLHIKTFFNKFIEKVKTKTVEKSISKDLNNVYDNMLYYNNDY